MARTLTIADAHSRNSPKQSIKIELSGGSPWFTYVWINDRCYIVTLDDETQKLEIHKQK